MVIRIIFISSRGIHVRSEYYILHTILMALYVTLVFIVRLLLLICCIELFFFVCSFNAYFLCACYVQFEFYNSIVKFKFMAMHMNSRKKPRILFCFVKLHVIVCFCACGGWHRGNALKFLCDKEKQMNLGFNLYFFVLLSINITFSVK